MRTICVDVDSTLCDHWVRIARNSMDGKILPSAFSREVVIQDQPLPGAAEALQHFKDKAKARIVVLTARDWDYPVGAVTREWLDEYGFCRDEIVIVWSAVDKPAFLCKHRPDLFIDDFTSRQEGPWPVIDTKAYIACVETGVPIEPFRNNWEEIVGRWLRNWELDDGRP